MFDKIKEKKSKTTELTKENINISEEEICLLPLRDIVVFPSMLVPIFIGRGKSIATIEEAMKRDKQIVVVAQRDGNINNPNQSDLFEIGVRANIIQMLKLQDNTIKLLIEANQKVKINALNISKPYLTATVETLSENLDYNDELAVKVTNPQSEEHTMLRQTLVANMLNVIKNNINSRIQIISR